MMTNITALFKTYKWLLLPIIPMLIFLGFLIYLFSTPPTPTPDISTPSATPSIETLPSISQPSESEEEVSENEFDEELELRPSFLKKETETSGTTRYFFTSENPNRPDIITLTQEKNLIFSRTLNSKELPLIPMSSIKEDFGEPERIIQGSNFHGSEASIYLYSSRGVAFIGNTQTNETFEEQRFAPMSAEAYLQRFGGQN